MIDVLLKLLKEFFVVVISLVDISMIINYRFKQINEKSMQLIQNSEQNVPLHLFLSGTDMQII